MTLSPFDYDECQVIAFRPLSEAARSWFYDKHKWWAEHQMSKYSFLQTAQCPYYMHYAVVTSNMIKILHNMPREKMQWDHNPCHNQHVPIKATNHWLATPLQLKVCLINYCTVSHNFHLVTMCNVHIAANYPICWWAEYCCLYTWWHLCSMHKR